MVWCRCSNAMLLLYVSLLLQYLLQSCSRRGRGIVEDMCYQRRRAERFGKVNMTVVYDRRSVKKLGTSKEV
jgi:hypothetical protein